MMSEIELTERQKIFCEQYINLKNGTAAAIKAGYSEDSAANIASENLRKPHIAAYIKKLRDDQYRQLGIDRTFISETFLKTIRKAEIDGDWGAVNKATELLGKHIGFFEEDNKQKKMEVVWKEEKNYAADDKTD